MEKNTRSKSSNEKKGLTVLKVFIIVGLVALLIAANFKRNEEIEQNDVAPLEYSDTEQVDTMAEAEDSMSNVYAALIQNSVAKLDESKQMYFGTDKKFDGYFNEEYPEVHGYTYEVTSLEGNDEDAQFEANVSVYNEDKSKCVQYKLCFSDEAALQLYCPETEVYVALEF